MTLFPWINLSLRPSLRLIQHLILLFLLLIFELLPLILYILLLFWPSLVIVLFLLVAPISFRLIIYFRIWVFPNLLALISSMAFWSNYFYCAKILSYQADRQFVSFFIDKKQPFSLHHFDLIVNYYLMSIKFVWWTAIAIWLVSLPFLFFTHLIYPSINQVICWLFEK